MCEQCPCMVLNVTATSVHLHKHISRSAAANAQHINSLSLFLSGNRVALGVSGYQLQAGRVVLGEVGGRGLPTPHESIKPF